MVISINISVLDLILITSIQLKTITNNNKKNDNFNNLGIIYKLTIFLFNDASKEALTLSAQMFDAEVEGDSIISVDGGSVILSRLMKC